MQKKMKKISAKIQTAATVEDEDDYTVASLCRDLKEIKSNIYRHNYYKLKIINVLINVPSAIIYLREKFAAFRDTTPSEVLSLIQEDRWFGSPDYSDKPKYMEDAYEYIVGSLTFWEKLEL